MTKSAKTCPSSAFRRSLVNVILASSNILLELLWYEPESMGGASVLRLPMPRLISPSLSTSPPLLSELGCNSKLGVVLSLCL